MTSCEGCKLHYTVDELGTLADGDFTINGGIGNGPIINLTHSTPPHQVWGTVRPIVTQNAAHGTCIIDEGDGTCIPNTPCAGLRYAQIVVNIGYTYQILANTLNTNSPFNCGTNEFITFEGYQSGISTPISNPYTVIFTCNYCG